MATISGAQFLAGSPAQVVGNESHLEYKKNAISSPETKPTFFEGVAQKTGQQYKQAGEKIVRSVEKGAQDVKQFNPDTDNPFTKAVKLASDTALGAASGASQGLFSPATAALQEVGERTNIHPLKALGNTEIGQKVKALMEAHPEATEKIMDLVNVLGTVAGAKGFQKGALGEALNTPVSQATKTMGSALMDEGAALGKGYSAAAGGVNKLLAGSSGPADKQILDYYTRAIKPSVMGKSTLGASKAYNENAVAGVREVAKNKANLSFTDEIGDQIKGKHPETVAQFAESIDQTKKGIYAQYDKLAQEAGQEGITVHPQSFIKDLQKVVTDKALGISHPEAVQYAKTMLKKYNALDPIDTVTAQKIIENYNAELQAFYRNPTYNTASKVAIDAGIVRELRKSLDDAISGATGEQYQSLKTAYGSLKAIEKDVAKRTVVMARQEAGSGGGAVKYIDALSGGDMLAGITNLNPSLFVKGAAQSFFIRQLKRLHSPDRAIKNMFKAVDAGDQAIPEIIPTKPSAGLAMENVAPDVPTNLANPMEKAGKSNLGVMKQFSDYVKGTSKPLPAAAKKLELDAQRLAQEYGFKAQDSNTLATSFDSFIDRAKEMGVFPEEGASLAKPGAMAIGDTYPKAVAKAEAAKYAPSSMPNIENHINSTKMIVDNMNMAEIGKLGGMPELIRRLKTNIVDDLKTHGNPAVATAIDKLDVLNFKDLDTFIRAIRDITK